MSRSIVLSSLFLVAGCSTIIGLDNEYVQNEQEEGTAGGGVSGAGGDGAPTEDCFDGMDTDGDGATDCADADCAAVAACGDLPKDWTLVRISGANPSEPPGKCGDGSTTGSLFFKDPAGAPECATCKCSDLSGASCTAPEIACYYDSNVCGGALDFKIKATSNQCYELSDNENPQMQVNIPGGVHNPGSCNLSGPATLQAPGSCLATGGEAMLASTWGSALLVCPGAANPGGCGGEDRCLPISEGSICITQAGDRQCPLGWALKSIAFLSGEDTRICSPCACEVGCEGGSYIVRDNAACSDLNNPVTVASSDCVTAPDIFDYDATSLTPTVATPVIAACQGGVGMGQVNPEGPQTICCRE